MSRSIQVYSPYPLASQRNKHSVTRWSLAAGLIFFLFGLTLGYMGYLDKLILPVSRELGLEPFRYTRSQAAVAVEKVEVHTDQPDKNTEVVRQLEQLQAIAQGEKGPLILKLKEQQSEIIALKRDKEDLQKQLHTLDSSNKVSQVAVKKSREALATMQEELAELKGELGLYQRLSASTNQSGKLTIQEFKIVRDPELGFQLVLTKGVGKNTAVKGTAYVSIQGKQNGRDKILNLSELNPALQNGLNFRFRFFQVLGGAIQWPEQFEPSTVFVRAIPETEGSEEISQRWSWSELSAKTD